MGENEVLLLRGEESNFIGADGGTSAAVKLQKRKGTAMAEPQDD